MSGPFFGQLRLSLICSIEAITLKDEKCGAMDTVVLHGDIMQPGGQLEVPGLVDLLLG